MFLTCHRDSPITYLQSIGARCLTEDILSTSLNNCPSIESSQLQTELIEVYQRSVADLAWKIAVLEEEVVRKELHLLSLYRAAFNQYLGVSPRVSAQVEQESHRQHSSRTTDEGTLRLRNIKESASYNQPTLSDSKRYVSQDVHVP